LISTKVRGILGRAAYLLAGVVIRA